MSAIETSPSIEAEFLRVRDVAKFCGLCRTTVYALIKSGKLKSKCIRQPGSTTGIRLISKQAIRDFIESCPDTPPGGGKEGA